MKYNTQQNKIQKLRNQEITVESELHKKDQPLISPQLSPNLIKGVKLLYDSGWLETIDADSTIIDSQVSTDDTHISVVSSSGNVVTTKDLNYPLLYQSSFAKDLQISEEFLPFIKIAILFQKKDGINEICPIDFYRGDPHVYEQNYYQILGDSSIIYQGYSPPTSATRQYSQTAVDTGEISFYSKVFYGNLFYDYSGYSWESRNVFIIAVGTCYDVVDAGEGHYNAKQFYCFAIDNLTSTSITGTGQYKILTWNKVGVDWILTETIEKNKTMTAPLFEDSLLFVNSGGISYRNGVQYGSPPGLLYEEKLVEIEEAGAFTVSVNITSANFTWNGNYRLWESSKRVSNVYLDGFGDLHNLPAKVQYEGEILYYSKFYVKLNQDGHPVLLDNPNYPSAPNTGLYFIYESKPSWMKVDKQEEQYTKHLSTYRIHHQMWFYVNTPASTPVSTNFSGIFETYSNNGSNYTKDATNRPPTVRTRYKASPLYLNFRFLITLINPQYFHKHDHYNQKET